MGALPEEREVGRKTLGIVVRLPDRGEGGLRARFWSRTVAVRRGDGNALAVLLARVAVPVPLGQAFTYAVSPELSERVQRGARVLCEFGRRRLLGVVLDVGEREPEIAPEKIKPLGAVVAEEPVLSEELLSFLQELGRYYVAPIGEVIQLALPALERSAARALGKAEGRVVGRVVQVASATLLAPSGVRGKAPELWAFLKESGPTELPALVERFPGARALVKRLQALGSVDLEEREAAQNTFFIDEDAAPDAADIALDNVENLNFLKGNYVLNVQDARVKP